MNTQQTKTQYLEKLQGLLYELFQFDSADLDFGFYAVMNQKREMISQFIQTDLLAAVADGLQHVAEQSQAEAHAAFQEARRNLVNTLGVAALDGDNLNPRFAETPVGKAYQKAQEARNAAVIAEDMEAQIYNDLYTFFGRYYQDGDFISQRRYGQSDKYAIPYNGQEVHLHWANFDQYYVKTGVHFQNYSFTIPSSIGLDQGANVHVRLTKVDIPRDNIKGDKRFFIYAADQSTQWHEDSQTLVIPMEYRPLTAEESDRLSSRNQQDQLLQEAHDAILQAIAASRVNPTLRARLVEPDPQKRTEKGRLAYHLNRYAAENTRDFFVHKDLGGFLRREFDYYLKAEVLRLEDITFDDPIHARRAAARLKTTRAIGDKIITFLDQLERFQRQLFLKRKFILQSDYCLTLDKIPATHRAAFYPEILANSRQLDEWQTLYGVAITPETNLDYQPHLMLDTGFFDAAFKARLLACFDDLDAATDGLLIHGESFQALNLLQSRYSSQIKCIYVDPPYNTGQDGFPYKDGYRHSSWLTMLDESISLAQKLMSPSAIISLSIDDNEVDELSLILDGILGEEQRAACAPWRSEPSGGKEKTGLRTGHEYLLIYHNGDISEISQDERSTGDLNLKDKWGSYRKGRELRKWGGTSLRKDRRNQYYALPAPDGTEAYPIRNDGKEGHWRWGQDNPEILKAMAHPDFFHWERTPFYAGVTYKGQSERWTPYEKIRDVKKSVGWSTWLDSFGTNADATRTLKDLFGFKCFETPKPMQLVKWFVSLHDDDEGTVLDFFAGSGTTAHTVMEINREDGSSRKYILVEMAEDIDTIAKPRIQKAAYTDEWNDGKPVRPGYGQSQLIAFGQSHMFHYIRLESYDDTFHNIRFRDLSGPQLSLLNGLPDYFLSYMLDHETAGSPALLNVQQFVRPFEYQLFVTNTDGVLQPQLVDLVATFNFLIGLTIHTICHYEYQGSPYVRVVGTNPEGKQVCVLWRNALPIEQLDAERDWVLANVLHDIAYDKLYVNGENTIPGSLLLEEEFRRRMFEGVR